MNQSNKYAIKLMPLTTDEFRSLLVQLKVDAGKNSNFYLLYLLSDRSVSFSV